MSSSRGGRPVVGLRSSANRANAKGASRQTTSMGTSSASSSAQSTTAPSTARSRSVRSSTGGATRTTPKPKSSTPPAKRGPVGTPPTPTTRKARTPSPPTSARTPGSQRQDKPKATKSGKVNLVSPATPFPATSKKYLFGWNNALQGQLRPQQRRPSDHRRSRGHSCVRYDNFMIIYGGYRGRPLSDMWALDTVSLRWSRFQTPTHTKHPGKRTGHAAAIIGEKMWLFGGETENHHCVNDLWAFDLGTKTWEEIITMDKLPSPRYGHTAVAFGTSIFVFGGADRSSQCFNDMWCFDTTNYTWAKINTEPRPAPRHGHTMTCVTPSKIFVFGGYGKGGRLNDLWQLDPFTLQWSSVEATGHIPTRRAYHSAVAMRFKLLIFGGQSAAALPDLWQFSPTSTTWTKIDPTRSAEKADIMENVVGPAARYGHSAEVFSSDKMFIYGGVGDASVYRDDLWFLYMDLSLPEPVEMEVQGSSAGLDISLPPIESFSLPSSIPAEESIRDGGPHSTEGNDDSLQSRKQNQEQTANDLPDLLNDNTADVLYGLRGMRDELSLQLDKVSADTRRFLLEEHQRARELATCTRRNLWEMFTAGLDIDPLATNDRESLTDADVTRMLKEARIVESDQELGENDVILSSYYASSFEKKFKRFDLRLGELERRISEQERATEEHRRLTESRQEEIVTYFEAKLEHEIKLIEAHFNDSLVQQRQAIEQTVAAQQLQLMQQLAEMRVLVGKTENGEPSNNETSDGTREKMASIESDLASLRKELQQTQERWEQQAEEKEEDEVELAQFEAGLRRTMEGTQALGSLMEQYLQNQNGIDTQDRKSPELQEGTDVLGNQLVLDRKQDDGKDATSAQGSGEVVAGHQKRQYQENQEVAREE